MQTGNNLLYIKGDSLNDNPLVQMRKWMSAIGSFSRRKFHLLAVESFTVATSRRTTGKSANLQVSPLFSWIRSLLLLYWGKWSWGGGGIILEGMSSDRHVNRLFIRAGYEIPHSHIHWVTFSRSITHFNSSTHFLFAYFKCRYRFMYFRQLLINIML